MSEARTAPQRTLRVAALAALTVVVAGALTIPIVIRDDLKETSLFYEQFARIEGPALALVAIFAIATLIVTFNRVDDRETAAAAVADSRRVSRIVFLSAI